jgi:nitrite reductase/ring-hydroxylating ferredoxin subunit
MLEDSLSDEYQTKFNVKTGAVVAGPAKNPKKPYRVRVTGEGIEVVE